MAPSSTKLAIREIQDEELAQVLSLYRLFDLPGKASSDDALQINQRHHAVFSSIRADDHQKVFVACLGNAVVGTFVLLVVPNLAHGCAPWALVENVVVDPKHRGAGIGRAMMEFARSLAAEQGCYKIVLTSNMARTEAHRFYEAMGWRKSHYGYSLGLRYEDTQT